MFEELTNLYIDAIEEAHSMWMSNYCCSREEAKEREEEDKEKIKEFVKLLKDIERTIECLTHTKN